MVAQVFFWIGILLIVIPLSIISFYIVVGGKKEINWHSLALAPMFIFVAAVARYLGM